jgi:hypothetical protein
MKQVNPTKSLCLLGTMIGVLLTASAPVDAQTYLVGEPAVGQQNGNNHNTSFLVSVPSVFDASQFAGATDVCAQISGAWTQAMSLGLTGATIDARSITGTVACRSNPFPSGATGTLLLGNTQIQVTSTWQIPPRVHVVGIGNSLLSMTGGSFENTEIQWTGNPNMATVVQLGLDQTSNGDYDVQIKNLTIDANGASVGILNDSAMEGSTVEDVDIFNASQIGLWLTTSTTNGASANNSGPYRNINVQYNSTECPTSCGTSTTGISVTTGVGDGELNSAVRGIDNVTVSGAGTSGKKIESCISVQGIPVRITNSHLEFCSTGITIGGSGNTPTNNVEVENVSTNNAGWAVTIAPSAGNGDVLLSGISVSGGTQVLNDSTTGYTITGPSSGYYLGFYLLGDDQSASRAVVTTASSTSTTNLKWIAPASMGVTGTLTAGVKPFLIDDPLDPANKYLSHSVVESPDMMNVYNGTATTDKRGLATVTLPEYFEALNKDFRYQLTPIGSFAQATVSRKIEGNHFTVRTSKPNVEVSWQVTGIRHDAYADAHRVQVEQEKPPRERGHYLHPELFETKGKQEVAEQSVDK